MSTVAGGAGGAYLGSKIGHGGTISKIVGGAAGVIAANIIEKKLKAKGSGHHGGSHGHAHSSSGGGGLLGAVGGLLGGKLGQQSQGQVGYPQQGGYPPVGYPGGGHHGHHGHHGHGNGKW